MPIETQSARMPVHSGTWLGLAAPGVRENAGDDGCGRGDGWSGGGIDGGELCSEEPLK
eukprot:CAMPEP_0181211188 /NCGR_PEP_ID=MMETSP1096-20121128/23646_1 /TAXON_ID=156174 ORGANISM="Chrysochromulina ericina, Strain CCMP281" /NCGR_SAMPLE_ID=MMETSP1096 /ASSEMBLY_ACC=CAM_ASM_000453 /LENGTH=57 /DNA_ID=CAMNT_0023302559 /DNA_START=881 /DNA_END=1054 /DNA_ORIENTATION=+